MVARYGVYFAIVVAAGSTWLGLRAGATFDYSLLRAVFVFVIFAVLAFGAEAVLTIGWQPRPVQPEPLPQPRPAEGGDDE
jgi:hypothetical protein